MKWIAQWIADAFKEAEKAMKPSGKKVFINIGHGKKPGRHDPGAVHAGTGKTEYDLNVIAANACKAFLEGKGHSVTLGGNEGGNYAGGKLARGHDVGVSLHHNSAVASAQGSECLYHRRKHTAEDIALSGMIAGELATELGIRNRGAKSLGASVLSGMKDVGVPVAVLPELYFIHEQPNNPDPAVFEEWSKRGGEAVGRAIHEYLS
ncbi:N-acetylmuramoyl-L-alanine amidase [Parasphingopyxis sp.]|uniref:N-acetylmuramoyl-L-alanine amidase n=1 Tax=Parasphingopyxis sp. TaxID=1920299 RepID=UPI00262CCD7A|nr:N-acetylmuramoyl-L-alanine amidase [Parasphingopyxis sp.]